MFLFPLVKTILPMYLLNNNCQWTKVAKGELNFPTQILFQSRQQNQTFHHTRKLCNQNLKLTLLIMSDCVCLTTNLSISKLFSIGHSRFKYIKSLNLVSNTN